MQSFQALSERAPRNSAAICAEGEAFLLKPGNLEKLGNERWTFLEQLFYAAIDLRKIDLATVVTERLLQKFPGSPRVKSMQGMILEASDMRDMAQAFYEKELEEDPANLALRKRLISLHLHGPTSSTSRQGVGIQMLVDYLDTVYTDTEAWEELVEAYASLGLYEQSLSAIGDLILLQPQNPFYTLRYAETAYTLNDLELAYNYYLKTFELAGFNLEKGPGRRTALGIKLCASKLKEGLPGSKAASPHSPSGTPSPQRLSDIDALITEKLFDAYSQEWRTPGTHVASEADLKALRGFTQNLIRV